VVDRVSVVVVVESHTANALFLGSSISLLSSMPQALETLSWPEHRKETKCPSTS
jgi:hypothetical protein